jgi:hypothetical protein
MADPVEHEALNVLAQHLIDQSRITTDDVKLEPFGPTLEGRQRDGKRPSKLREPCRPVVHRAEPAEIVGDLAADADAGLADPYSTSRPVDLGVDTRQSRQHRGRPVPSEPLDVQVDAFKTRGGAAHGGCRHAGIVTVEQSASQYWVSSVSDGGSAAYPQNMPRNEKDFVFDDGWIEKALNDVLGKSDRQLSQEELAELLDKAVLESLPGAGRSLLRNVKKLWPAHKRWQDKVRRRFDRNLQNTWGEGLDRIKMLAAFATELGEMVNQHYRPKAAQDRDAVFEAVTRLHARGCHIAHEILVLLDAGLASGAHARWRALHEVVIVSAFLAKHDQDTAERYLLHDTASAAGAAEEYQRYADQLGEKPISPERMVQIEEDRADLRERYGPCYDRENGWAIVALGRTCPTEHWSKPRCRVTIAELEQAVDLQHQRPYYRMASHTVHAGPRGIHWNLEIGDTAEMMIAGPVDHGLADPAGSTAQSLVQLTMTAVMMRPSYMLVSGLRALEVLAQEAQVELMKSHELGERRAAANDRLWRWQDWVLRRRPR